MKYVKIKKTTSLKRKYKTLSNDLVHLFTSSLSKSSFFLFISKVLKNFILLFEIIFIFFLSKFCN